MNRQLTLNVELRDDATLESFYPGNNQEALMALRTLLEGTGDSFLYLFGIEGVGRTHLLQAACHKATEAGGSAFYLSLQDLSNLNPDIFQDLEQTDLICIDDIDNIAGITQWEEALFHLFNRIREVKGRLIIAANDSPKAIPISLPDLKSRLAWGVCYQLHRLTDEQKSQALALRARHRGLKLSESVTQFLLSRSNRNMTLLFQTLEKLDKASLAEQRAITIPFVKQVLGL